MKRKAMSWAPTFKRIALPKQNRCRFWNTVDLPKWFYLFVSFEQIQPAATGHLPSIQDFQRRCTNEPGRSFFHRMGLRKRILLLITDPHNICVIHILLSYQRLLKVMHRYEHIDQNKICHKLHCLSLDALVKNDTTRREWIDECGINW